MRASIIDGGAFQPPDQREPTTNLPSFCRVSIVVVPRLNIELAGARVRVKAMHCLAPSIRVAVNGELHEVAASESRRFTLK
jgi:hypothetical protein